MREELELFTWGYWGWGNATSHLVEAMDAVERVRGFAPLLFADIRWSRGVRAKGFQNRTFETLVGPSRYRWMRSLGNRAIGGADSAKIEIADPAAAAELLDLAEGAQNQRVLFFCACERPRGCHRVEVATLVLEEARRRKRKVEIVEWPGDVPRELRLEVSSKILRQVVRGRATIPLEGQLALEVAAAVPHCSRAALVSEEGEVSVIVGPAVYRGGWALPVQGRGGVGEAGRLRGEWGLEARLSG